VKAACLPGDAERRGSLGTNAVQRLEMDGKWDIEPTSSKESERENNRRFRYGSKREIPGPESAITHCELSGYWLGAVLRISSKGFGLYEREVAVSRKNERK